MNHSERLDFTLEQVALRVGDPAPLVFERLFAEAPELRALFCNDASGAVRAEMFLRALECLQDAAGARLYGSALVAAEHSTHQVYGVPTAMFQRFFVVLVDVFRDTLGPDWTPEIDQAWAQALQAVGAATA